MLPHIRRIESARPRPTVTPVPRLPRVQRDEPREEGGAGDGEEPGRERRRPVAPGDEGHIDVRA